MGCLTASIAIGTASANPCHAADLGKTITLDGKTYRMAKNTSTLAAAATKIVVSALSSGAPTWSFATTTTAGLHNPAGVIPLGQVGSTGTTSLIAGDYYFIQIGGPAKVLSGGAIADGGLVGTSTTAGKADDASVVAGVGAIGVALEAASGADEVIDVLLKGNV